MISQAIHFTAIILILLLATFFREELQNPLCMASIGYLSFAIVRDFLIMSLMIACSNSENTSIAKFKKWASVVDLVVILVLLAFYGVKALQE